MQLEIKTTIDAFNPIQVKALHDFLVTIGANSDLAVHSELHVPLGDKPKLTRKKAEKVETTPEGTQATFAAIEAEETKAEAIEVVEPETVSGPTLEDVRALVRDKIAISRGNMALIKTKLIECGSQNVSTLDAKHFQTIFDFLTEL